MHGQAPARTGGVDDGQRQAHRDHGGGRCDPVAAEWLRTLQTSTVAPFCGAGLCRAGARGAGSGARTDNHAPARLADRNATRSSAHCHPCGNGGHGGHRNHGRAHHSRQPDIIAHRGHSDADRHANHDRRAGVRARDLRGGRGRHPVFHRQAARHHHRGAARGERPGQLGPHQLSGRRCSCPPMLRLTAAPRSRPPSTG